MGVASAELYNNLGLACFQAQQVPLGVASLLGCRCLVGRTPRRHCPLAFPTRPPFSSSSPLV